jgi:hypothetical protein
MDWLISIKKLSVFIIGAGFILSLAHLVNKGNTSKSANV